MVNLATVKASNAHLQSTPGLTFVFAGATAGIGLSTLIAFAKHTTNPTAYIIGRSREKFQPHLDELHRINPAGKWVFLEGQFTLLKEGKRLANEIIRQVSSPQGGGKIDAVITSTGYLTFNGAREDTEEGIDADCALIYYNRLLLTTLLLPLLSASPSPRVLSIFSATSEGPFTLEELQSEWRIGFARMKITFTMASLTTLSFEHLAQQYPSISFIHSHPGGVNTGIIDKLFDTAKGIWSYPAWFAKRFIAPILWLVSAPFAVPVEESGERHLFLATSAAYPPLGAAGGASASPNGSAGGLAPLVTGLEVKRSSVEREGKGSGAYRTTASCEAAGDKKWLVDARAQGLDVAGWRETVKVFERVLGEGVVRGL